MIPAEESVERRDTAPRISYSSYTSILFGGERWIISQTLGPFRFPKRNVPHASFSFYFTALKRVRASFHLLE